MTDNVSGRKQTIASKKSFRLIYVVTLAVLLGLSTLLNNGILAVILVVLSLYGLKEPFFIFPVLLISALSSNYFVLVDGIGITRVVGLIFLIGAGIPLLTGKKKIDLRLFFMVVMLVLFLVLSAVFSPYPEQATSSISVFFLSAALLLVVASSDASKEECGLMIRDLALSSVIVSWLVFINITVNSSVVYSRVTVEGVNENRLAILLVQLAAVCLTFILIAKNKAARLVLLGTSLLDLYMVFKTGSRTGLIAFCGGVLIALLFYGISKGVKVKSVFVFLIVVLCGYLVVSAIIRSDETLSQRFTIESIIASKGTHRLDMILAELRYVIPEHFWFGVGPSSVCEKNALLPFIPSGYVGSSHNIIVAMFTELGLFGFTAFWTLIATTYFKCAGALKRRKEAFVPFVCLSCAIVNGIGELVFPERWFWLLLGFAVLFIRSAQRQDTERKEL